MRARRTALLIAAVVALTLVGTIVALNFMSGEKKIERRLERLYSLDDPRFAQELGVLLGPPLLEGNRYRVLKNGDEIFPPMLAAIRDAKRTINFETYIYWSGEIGRRFADALIERARVGVKVHVMLDWVGSAKMDESMVAEMANAGVQVRKFHPPHWSHLGRFNNRTHRKLLVVDGHIGFTGGVGIAPQWTGRAQDPEHWRDTHFEVEGPVVAQMRAVFLDNWIKVSGEVLHGPDYFPLIAPTGTGRARMFSSSPTGGSESMELMYLLITAVEGTPRGAIRRARRLATLSVGGDRPQVTGAGLNSTSELARWCLSAPVRRPLATSRTRRNNSQPVSSIVAVPSAMRPSSRSIRSCHRFAMPLVAATLTTGTSARP